MAKKKTSVKIVKKAPVKKKTVKKAPVKKKTVKKKTVKKKALILSSSDLVATEEQKNKALERLMCADSQGFTK